MRILKAPGSKRKTRLAAAFSKSIWNTGLRPVVRSFPLPVRIEPKLCSPSLGVGFGFAPALLIWCLKRAQAPHFIEDAFRVQLAFQPFERAIHWFAFSNNDFWHQFTSIPKKFAHFNPGQTQFTPAVHAASNCLGRAFQAAHEENSNAKSASSKQSAGKTLPRG
jgi:hypothetical protein